MATIALHQAGYIDAAMKAEWMVLSTPRLAVRFGWSDQYDALQADSDRRRAPQQLLARAIRGMRKACFPHRPSPPCEASLWKPLKRSCRRRASYPLNVRSVELPDVHVDWAALDEDLNAPDDHQDTTAETEAQ